MKAKILFVCTFMLIGLFGLKAQSSEKVNYFEGTLSEAFQESAKLNKPVFFEGYTDWCYYCKKLSRSTMKDDEVYNYLNQNYIAIKINMDTPEGMEIAKDYKISGYPTMLIFTPKGKMDKKIVGYLNSKNLLAKLQ